jgi:hypothetical protein
MTTEFNEAEAIARGLASPEARRAAAFEAAYEAFRAAIEPMRQARHEAVVAVHEEHGKACDALEAAYSAANDVASAALRSALRGVERGSAKDQEAWAAYDAADAAAILVWESALTPLVAARDAKLASIEAEYCTATKPAREAYHAVTIAHREVK